MKIYLDNIPVAFPNDSLIYPTLTLRKQDETGEKSYSFTGDLKFEGKDFNYLYSQLVSSTNALNNKVVMKFENDCCTTPQIYEFYITHKSLKWCEGACSLTAAAIEKSLSQDQLTCLKNTMIYDNRHGFQNQNHPRFSYCDELRPSWLQDALILLTIATASSIGVIGPVLAGIAFVIVTINFVIGIINDIIDGINTLLPPGSEIGNINEIDFDNDPSTNAFTEFENYIKQALSWAVACGRKHPSPLVRDYIKNVCKVCGLNFQSSILNNPTSKYYNTCYVNAPVTKGVPENDTNTFWIDKNKPLLNGTRFLNQIKSIFNADWKIQNSILTFERRDFFVPKTPWLDLTILDSQTLISLCWQWSPRARYSYGNFQYQVDSINWVGGEARDRWGDIVEWNQNPYSPLQKDALEPLFEFSAARFREDGIERDVLTTYENFPYVGPIIRKYKNVLLLNSNNCYLPMLLIWDGQSVSEARVDGVNTYFPGYPGGAGANQFYNYPFWFDASIPGNMYDNFWAIENPRSSNYQGFDFTAEIKYNCSMLAAIDLDGVIMTPKGPSKELTSIVINFKNNSLTITGTV